MTWWKVSINVSISCVTWSSDLEWRPHIYLKFVSSMRERISRLDSHKSTSRVTLTSHQTWLHCVGVEIESKPFFQFGRRLDVSLFHFCKKRSENYSRPLIESHLLRRYFQGLGTKCQLLPRFEQTSPDWPISNALDKLLKLSG